MLPRVYWVSKEPRRHEEFESGSLLCKIFDKIEKAMKFYQNQVILMNCPNFLNVLN